MAVPSTVIYFNVMIHCGFLKSHYVVHKTLLDGTLGKDSFYLFVLPIYGALGKQSKVAKC